MYFETYDSLLSNEDVSRLQYIFFLLACGIPYSKIDRAKIKGGKINIRTPWNTAIYDIEKNHTLICGGTIISKNVVISGKRKNYNKN